MAPEVYFPLTGKINSIMGKLIWMNPAFCFVQHPLRRTLVRSALYSALAVLFSAH